MTINLPVLDSTVATMLAERKGLTPTALISALLREEATTTLTSIWAQADATRPVSTTQTNNEWSKNANR